MALRHRKYKEIFLACIILVNVVITNSYDGPDLQGKYCESRKNGCCNGRQDECSVPIKGTLCYCDDFCNRTHDDCCPDYLPYCKGIDTYYQLDCRDTRGNVYRTGEIFQNNCNKCECKLIGNTSEILCETHQCVVDEEILENVNRNYRSYTWRASNYSTFWGKKYEEATLSRLGTLHSRRKVLQMQPIRHPVNVRELPRNFDARIQWPGRISLPMDQGWCGASWALSTAAVISDRFDIMTRGNDHVVLSPQHLLSCNVHNQRGCSGGHLTRAWMFIRKYGLVSDECYPWEGSVKECRVPRHAKPMEARCPSSNLIENGYLYRVGPVYRLGTEQDIMYEIIHSGPVQAVIRISRDFFSYKSGVYRCSSIANTADRFAFHAVRIIGWGEEKLNNENVKYWIVSNSWGTWWGEDGFFRIRRGTNECLIEDFVVAAWVKIDKTNTFYNPVKTNFINP